MNPQMPKMPRLEPSKHAIYNHLSQQCFFLHLSRCRKMSLSFSIEPKPADLLEGGQVRAYENWADGTAEAKASFRFSQGSAWLPALEKTANGCDSVI